MFRVWRLLLEGRRSNGLKQYTRTSEVATEPKGQRPHLKEAGALDQVSCGVSLGRGATTGPPEAER